MKDLYLQLGIDPHADQSDIEAALRQHPELGDAAAILLNAPRRAAYNRSVSTVRSIGMLRHRLGLDAQSTWFVETCPDFAPRLHLRKYAPPPEVSAKTATAEPAPTATYNSSSWLKVGLLIVTVAAILLAMSRIFI